MSKNKSLYLFPQQGEDSACHCYPWFNLEYLPVFRKNLANNNADWRSHEYWTAYTFEGIAGWQMAMERLTNPEYLADKSFANWQNNLLDKGISLENMYTKSGKKYYSSSINPLKNMQRFWLAPYNFVNATEHPKAVQKTLPIYLEDNNLYFYDYKIEQKIKLEQTEDTLYKTYLVLNEKKYLIDEEYLNFLNIPNGSEIYLNKRFCSYQYLPEQAKENIYFHVGLYQLMLLALGVDNNNEEIHSAHELYDAFRNFDFEMGKYKNNPWKLKSFKKENLLEYNVTNIFKEYPELMDEAIVTSKCFFNTYEHYEKLSELTDSNKCSLEFRKQYLPGKEQILAYSFVQSLRISWAAAVSNKAFNAVLEIPKIIIPLTHLPGFSNERKVLKNIYKQYDINGEKISFIDTWQKIKAKLKQKHGFEKDYVSFDGHGVVLSFAEDLKQISSKMKVKCKKTIQNLDFTIIDSLYSKAVEPFYRSQK